MLVYVNVFQNCKTHSTKSQYSIILDVLLDRNWEETGILKFSTQNVKYDYDISQVNIVSSLSYIAKATN